MNTIRIRTHFLYFSFAILFCRSLFAPPLPHPTSSDIAIARALLLRTPDARPAEIADQVMISEEYKKLLSWMQNDLANYEANFDAIFDAKLQRIRKHENERNEDLAMHTEAVRRKIELGDKTLETQAELERLTELHKPFGFALTYTNAEDFTSRFVGPRRKLLKMDPTAEDTQKMNQGGVKELYVDTWSVPFFNTGTQTREQAKAGVAAALGEFRRLDLQSDISVLKFTQLMALFARPEFDDVRRYKLIPFPTERDLQRFGGERSDAKTFGDKYPGEAPAVLNRPIDLGPVSFIYGQRVHLFGLISHSVNENIADGRIFTGPADFLEHDFAHAFFNLAPVIPGGAEEWEAVHREFIKMRDAEKDPRKKKMMRLVYYHFTHESGFRNLLNEKGESPPGAFEHELDVIKELMKTRHHYDFVLKDGLFADGYEAPLNEAFGLVGNFFKDNFLRIYRTHLGDCDKTRTALGEMVKYGGGE